MRLLVTGGGTGGHVNPAIAIANAVRDNTEGSEIAFVGTSKGIENKLVPKEGYKLHHVEIQGLRRKLTLSNLRTAYLFFTSPLKAKKLIREFKPDMVVGTGGYVCWPVVKAAASMGIPTALHESNAVPGVAVKMLEKHVDKVYTNFEETKKYLKFPEKVVRVGNPIKKDFFEGSYAEARRKLGIPDGTVFILSYGGSMGAERVNEEVLKVMRDFSSKRDDVLHIHGTGSIEYEIAKKMYADYRLCDCKNLEIREYIYDMPLLMQAADIVIARAGAMTLSELAALKKTCILIPSPNVANNHQYKNAKVLADKGGAMVFEEKDLSCGVLTEAVASLADSASKRRKMSENIAEFAVKGADKVIFDHLVHLLEEKKK